MNDTDTVTGLPPAGFQRDEELRRRADKLAEKAEIRADQLDMNTINPQALVPDRELQHLLQEKDALMVTNAQPGMVYSWVFTGIHGQMVTMKKAQGWETVQGNDPECADFKYVDTTRRVGDTILMRIRMDKHFLLEERERRKRERRERGLGSDIKALGEKHGIQVHTDVKDSPYFSSAQKKAPSVPARVVAAKRVDRMLREGNVPGMPVPSKE